VANDCIPFKQPGENVTAKAEGAVTGKRCVQISGPRTSGPGLAATAEGSVYVCGIPSTTGALGADKKVFGVAAWDAADTTLFTVIRGGIVPITASAAITAGAEVEVDADGRVSPLTTGIAIGVCCGTVSGAGVDAEIALY
jgi:hypothetical protein